MTNKRKSIVKPQNWIRTQRWPRTALELPRLQSHRGLCRGEDGRQIKENSLEAFREAKSQGALMVECDVRLSADLIPVIYHDKDLLRLDSSKEEIVHLKAKVLRSQFSIPSLQDLLLDPQSPRLVNIELKSKEILGDALERKVAEVVIRTKSQDRVLFSSFNPFSLFRMTGYLPEVPRALLVSQSDDPENKSLLKDMYLAPLLSIHLLHLESNMVDEISLAQWLDQKVPVAVWTVNDGAKIEKYLKWGAVSIISDLSPKAVKEVIL